MTWQAWTTIGVVLGMILVLIRGRFGPDVVVVGAVALLVFLGILTPSQALAGMANPGMATVAVLYVVVCGLTETGAVQWIGSILLGRPKTQKRALLRLMLPVTVLSGFVNNTPVVAMMIPAIEDFCRRRSWPVSKFMMPLSYAAILGGTCTLIGTSTNLVVYGEWTESGREPMGLFVISILGVPVAVAGILYLMTIGQKLLPDRGAALRTGSDSRAYTVEMIVSPDGPIAGKTIEQAGLRQLPGLYLAEIERGGIILAAVGPNERLQNNDRLVFVGQVDSVVDLQKVRGLETATDQTVKLHAPRPDRVLVEAVVSNSHPLLGMTIREGGFRTKYNAVIIAVARNGEQIRKKIGDIVIRTGDTLLLEAPRSFVVQMRDARDYYLVSEVAGFTPPRHDRAIISISIVLLMVAIATVQPVLPIPMLAGGGNVKLTMIHAAVLAAGLMLITRCCYGWQARKNVDWIVLVTIAGSLGLGRALQVSGAADGIASLITTVAGSSPWLTLVGIYLMTMILTEMVTNTAAAVLMFFVAEAAAEGIGVDLKPFALTVMMAASASFSTPLGYQTNLMVLGPGGYKYSDYLRVGLPLNAIAMAITVVLAPLVFGFGQTR
ncbi:MAG TPA: SLC13 family permease [Phycisphaerales bacterium]|nr:SLC13 family permease [Phycisphaerales bacterium]